METTTNHIQELEKISKNEKTTDAVSPRCANFIVGLIVIAVVCAMVLVAIRVEAL